MKNQFSTTPAGTDIGVCKKRKNPFGRLWRCPCTIGQAPSWGSAGCRHHEPGWFFLTISWGWYSFTMSQAIDCHHLPRENLSPAAGLMFVTVQFSSWAGAIFVHCDSVSPSAEVNCCSPWLFSPRWKCSPWLFSPQWLFHRDFFHRGEIRHRENCHRCTFSPWTCPPCFFHRELSTVIFFTVILSPWTFSHRDIFHREICHVVFFFHREFVHVENVFTVRFFTPWNLSPSICSPLAEVKNLLKTLVKTLVKN